MTVGPISGQAIPITLTTGKTMFCWANTQAAYNQYVRITDSGGNVVFTCQGASTPGGAPTQIGQATFVVGSNPNYTVSIGINGGSQWSTILWDQQVLNIGAQVYCTAFSFIAEDGADSDYNDVYLSLVWFNSLG